MKRMLACDPATHFGWAYSSNGCDYTTGGAFDLSVKRDESGGMKLIRLVGKLNEIRESVGIDLLAFEAARHAMPGMQGALVCQAEIQGVVKHWCEENKIEYRGYSSKEIKKFSVGTGNANKEKMVAEAKRRWPDVEIQDDNMADAMLLLALVMSEYGEQ